MKIKNLFRTKITKVHEIIQKELNENSSTIKCEVEVIHSRSHTTVNDKGVVPFLVTGRYHTKINEEGQEYDRRFISCDKITISTQSIVQLCKIMGIDEEYYAETLMGSLIENLKHNLDPYNINSLPISL